MYDDFYDFDNYDVGGDYEVDSDYGFSSKNTFYDDYEVD